MMMANGKGGAWLPTRVLQKSVTHSTTQHGTELARFHGKTDKRGDAMVRPSCQSSLLGDPNANFSVEIWRRSTIKEGRHVGLDFYDLLIEADYSNRDNGLIYQANSPRSPLGYGVS